jgi:hypothetical protein
MAKKKKRIAPKTVNGSIDRSAPFWRGDTAERILEQRLIERANNPRGRRRSSGPRTPRTPSDERTRTLKRLERALIRRKTLAARQRVEQRIKDLRHELGLES